MLIYNITLFTLSSNRLRRSRRDYMRKWSAYKRISILVRKTI